MSVSPRNTQSLLSTLSNSTFCVRASLPKHPPYIHFNSIYNFLKRTQEVQKNERLLEWRYWESNPGFESIYDVHNLMSYR
jgi:hypothetical protein